MELKINLTGADAEWLEHEREMAGQPAGRLLVAMAREYCRLRDEFIAGNAAGAGAPLTHQIAGLEERLVATIERVREEHLEATLDINALLALLEAKVRWDMANFPEVPAEKRAEAAARARDRFDRLLKTLPKGLTPDGKARVLAVLAKAVAESGND